MAKNDGKSAEGQGADNSVPEVGAVHTTADASHRIVSSGDGTGREYPVVNQNGEYPPRPEGWNDPATQQKTK